MKQAGQENIWKGGETGNTQGKEGRQGKHVKMKVDRKDVKEKETGKVLEKELKQETNVGNRKTGKRT